MNAARRAIISEMRHQGITGKEAYEASKDPGFMRDWVRVSVRDQRPEGKPKRQPKKHKWSARLRFLKQLATLQAEKISKKKAPIVRRARFIKAQMDKGLSLSEAIKAWESPKEKND